MTTAALPSKTTEPGPVRKRLEEPPGPFTFPVTVSVLPLPTIQFAMLLGRTIGAEIEAFWFTVRAVPLLAVVNAREPLPPMATAPGCSHVGS